MSETGTVPDIETIVGVVKELMADLAGQAPETIDDATGLDALGIDSLLIVEVVVGVDRRFGVKVPPSEFRADIYTVGQVSQALGSYVHRQLSGL